MVCLPGIGTQSIQETFIEHLLYARHRASYRGEYRHGEGSQFDGQTCTLISITVQFFSLNLPSFSYLFLLPSKK